MKPLLALLGCTVVIVWLFLLNRNRKARTSWALLIPLFWLLIAGSRNVGEWLQMGAPGEGDAYTEGNALDRNLLMGVIAVGVIALYQRRDKVGRVLQANWPILLYFTYCLISLSWSEYPFVGLKRWIRALGDVVMVLIVLTDRDWLNARRRLYAWAGFLLVPTSILLIRHYPQLGRAYGTSDGKAYWTGVATGKNELGMICMIVGLAAASRLIDIYRRREQGPRTKLLIAHGTLLAMVAWLIHMADSATSLACLLLGSGVLILTSWRPLIRRPVLVHMLVLAMLFVSFSALFLNLGSGLVQNLGRDSTLTGRTDLWAHIFKLVDNPMFGAGYESFWIGTRLEKMRDFANGVNQAHNGYLEVYLNLGWVGVTLLAIVILTGYRNVIAAFKRHPDPSRLRLAYFVIALAYNFTEGAFKFRSPVWISFLLATMAVPSFTSVYRKARAVASTDEMNRSDDELLFSPSIQPSIHKEFA